MKKIKINEFTISCFPSGYVDIDALNCDHSIDSTTDEPELINTIENKLLKYKENGKAKRLFSDCDPEEPSQDFYVIVFKKGTDDCNALTVFKEAELNVLIDAVEKYKNQNNDDIISINHVVMEDDLF